MIRALKPHLKTEQDRLTLEQRCRAQHDHRELDDDEDRAAYLAVAGEFHRLVDRGPR